MVVAVVVLLAHQTRLVQAVTAAAVLVATLQAVFVLLQEQLIQVAVAVVKQAQLLQQRVQAVQALLF
jgi:hypothetical protein